MTTRFPRLLALAPLVLTTAAQDQCTLRILLDGTEPIAPIADASVLAADERTAPSPATCAAGELHAIGIYETIDRNGDADVYVERPGAVRLALSSYESTRWHIHAGPDTVITEVHLSAYGPSTAEVDGVEVARASLEDGSFLGCGYELPDLDPTSGCETDELLAALVAQTGIEPSAFHGCYAANGFFVAADGSATSECDEAAGYATSSVDLGLCTLDDAVALDQCPAGGFAFVPARFDFPRDDLSCDGEQHVRFDERYSLFVGTTACEDGAVRVYLAADAAGPYLPATDTAGHGQDHCELLNDTFTLANEDDITSGGCTDCATSSNLPLEYVDTWTRAILGEQFVQVQSGEWSYQTSRLHCGVDVGVCTAEDDVAQ